MSGGTSYYIKGNSYIRGKHNRKNYEIIKNYRPRQGLTAPSEVCFIDLKTSKLAKMLTETLCDFLLEGRDEGIEYTNDFVIKNSEGIIFSSPLAVIM